MPLEPLTATIKLKKPHPTQMRVLNGAKRFNAITCGRRWGKTEGIGMNRAVMAAAEGHPVGWFAPTYKMLADAWRAICRIVAPITKRRDTQEKRLELLTGGSIDFWTLDTPDAGRGRKYWRVIIDEAAMVKELRRAWQAAILPTLSDYAGDAFLLTTPRGYDDYYELTRTFDALKEGATFRMPTSTNPYIRPDVIEMARQVMSAKFFAQEYEASFESMAGRIIHAFDYHENVVENEYLPTVPAGPILAGLDFNVNPMTCSLAVPVVAKILDPITQRTREVEELVFFDEIELHDSGTDEMCGELKRRFKGRERDLVVYPDPTGGVRGTAQKKGVTNFTIIEDHQLRLQVSEVILNEDKFNEINALCMSAAGHRRLKVLRRCKRLITCFEQYSFKENTSVPDKGKFDHFVDGAGNIIHNEFPIQRDEIGLEEAYGV